MSHAEYALIYDVAVVEIALAADELVVRRAQRVPALVGRGVLDRGSAASRAATRRASSSGSGRDSAISSAPVASVRMRVEADAGSFGEAREAQFGALWRGIGAAAELDDQAGGVLGAGGAWRAASHARVSAAQSDSGNRFM